MRSDHPSNSKRGGACIYYKETYIPFRVINVNYLNECIRFELNIGEKLCSFISLYRSPIQTQDEFDTFTDNLLLNLDLAVQSNPYLVAVLGDFNGKLKTWYGCYKTNFEGNVLKTPFSQFGLHQMINNSTHISDTYSLCADLIFTTQPNLVVESRHSPILKLKFCGNSICKPLEII